MSRIDSASTPRRPRRRLAAWLAFGAIGLATGAVWATGFASLGGSTGTDVAAPIVAPSTPVDHVASLNGLITANASPFTVNWSGQQGSLPVDKNYFTVDLSAESALNTYNIAFLLGNATALSASGWSSLQLKVEQLEATGSSGTVCTPSDYNGTNDPKVMDFDASDAGVYWNGLAGGAIYCLGVDASVGQDQDGTGTFLRRSDSGVVPTYPRFIATVDRAS
jgi:hypothetical protein